MMTEIMQKNSVQKLKVLLQNRYGMGLKITTMTSIENAGVDVQEMRSELRGSSLHVPVCARGKYLATAILTRSEPMSAGDISAVSEIVRLVLEPLLLSIYLERQESNTAVIQDENVLLLRPQESFEANDGSDWNPDGLEFNQSLIMLESYNPHTISRVAVHIHEAAGRLALLRYKEVHGSLNSVQDIRELGTLTLLVEDVLQLSPEEQARLATFASSANEKTEPLILIGCTTPLDELVEDELINIELAEIAEKSHLELDRMPKEFSQLRETIEMALDKHALI